MSVHFLGTVLSATMVAAVGVAVAIVLGAARQIIVARALGPEGFGLIAFAESLENLIIRVAPLGLTVTVPALLAGSAARRDDIETGRVLGTSAMVGAALVIAPGVLLFGLADLLAGWLDVASAGPVLRIWGVVVVGLGACQVAASMLRGLLRISAATIVRDVVPNLFILGGAAAAVWLGFSVPQVAVAYAVGAVGAAFLAVAVVRRQARAAGITPTAHRADVTKLLRLSGPVLSMLVAGQLMRQMNAPILTAATDIATFGVFSAALFIATTAEAGFTSLALIYLPFASALRATEGDDALAEMQSAVGRWTYAIFLVPIALLSAAADPVIDLLFGPAYREAAGALRILLVGLLVTAAIGPRNTVLLALGRGRSVSIGFVLALAAAFVVAVTLTPWLGMRGSALSFTVGLSLRAIVSEPLLRRALPGSGMRTRDLITVAGTGLVAAAAIVPNSTMAWTGPLLALLMTALALYATRDDTDRQLLSFARSRLRARAGRRPSGRSD